MFRNALVLALVACGGLSCSPRQARPETAPHGVSSISGPSAKAPSTSFDAGASADSSSDAVAEEKTCFLTEELENPMHPTMLERTQEDFARRARERLLTPERAEAIAGPLARKAADALASGRFESLSALLGREGLCLRAAKGADCIRLTADEVARCGRDRKKHDWPVDSGEDGPHLHTCADAMRSIFLRYDVRQPTSVSYNCFPFPGRGNNALPVLLRPARAFVDFHFESEPWQSLWFVFDQSKKTPGSNQCNGRDDCDSEGQRLYLVELVAEYWGI